MLQFYPCRIDICRFTALCSYFIFHNTQQSLHQLFGRFLYISCRKLIECNDSTQYAIVVPGFCIVILSLKVWSDIYELTGLYSYIIILKLFGNFRHTQLRTALSSPSSLLYCTLNNHNTVQIKYNEMWGE